MAITRVTGSPNAVLANKIISCYLLFTCGSWVFIYELLWKEFESHQRWLTLLVSNVCLTGTASQTRLTSINEITMNTRLIFVLCRWDCSQRLPVPGLSFPAFPCVRLAKSTEVTDRTNTATKFHPLSLFSSCGRHIETQDCLPRRVNS